MWQEACSVLTQGIKSNVGSRKSRKPKLKLTKAGRLLYLINLIKSHENLGSKELAEKCGVSERTIFRDINDLASAGLPIYYDQGYKFLEGAFLPTLNLTKEELSALRFALEFSPLKVDHSLSYLAEGIYAKLEAGGKKYNFENKIRAHLTQRHEFNSDDLVDKFFTMFKMINQAIAQKKQIKIRYKKHASQVRERLIEPYALVERNLKWWILCCSSDGGKITCLDLSKIENVCLTPQSFKSRLNFEQIFSVCP